MGRKNRTPKKRKPSWLLIVSSLLALLIAVLWLTGQGSPKQEKPKESEGYVAAIGARHREAIKALGQFFDESYGEESWWLLKYGANDKGYFEPVCAKTVDDNTGRILNLLGDLTKKSSEAKKIYFAFRGYEPGMYKSRQEGFCLTGSHLEVNAKGTYWLRLAFYPKSQFKPEEMLCGAAFTRDLQVIEMPAVNLPDGILAAMLFHEMRHAYHMGVLLENPEDEAHAHVADEIATYRFTTEILDLYSKGQYSKGVDAVVERSVIQGVTDPEDVLDQVSCQDYKNLAATICSKKLGHSATAFFEGVTMMAIMDAAVEKLAPADRKADAKERLYHTVGTILTGHEK